MVRPRTGLHGDKAAGRQLRTPPGEPVTLQLLGHDHSTRRIHRVNLDHPLRQVDADTCNLAHGLTDFPFPLQIDFDNQSWHSMPVLDCGKSLRIRSKMRREQLTRRVRRMVRKA